MSSSPATTSLLARALSGRYDWATGDEADVGLLDIGLLDIGLLQRAAIDHGIGALLWDTLAGKSGTAETLRDALTPGVLAAAARDVFEQRELQAVTVALADAGVPSLITKGSALAYTVYRQPWLRPRTDTDLLVRAGDMPAAALVLERCGYSRSHAVSTGALVSHQIVFQRSDTHRVSHVIDLHWKTANPQVVADALAFDDLWNDAQLAPALGGSARVPPAVASLALACVHRLAHHQRNDRLIWLYDVKLLAAALSPDDWSSLRELACGHGIAGFCLDGLRSAQAHLGSQLPQAVEDALAAAAPTEASRAYVSGFVTKRDVLWSDLKTLDTWSHRVRLVREHAFPPVAFIQQRYGTSARWLLPALYVHRLLTGALRWGRS